MIRQVLIKRPVLIFCCIICIALMLLGRKAFSRPSKSMVAMVVAAALALPFLVIYRVFDQVDMMSFLFHAEAGINGVSPDMLRDDILTTLGSLIGLLLISYLMSSVRWLRHLPLLTAIVLLLGNPFVVYQAKRLLQPVPDVDLAALLTKPEIGPNPLPPDIVYIYLEGSDRRFLDPDLAPKAAVALRDLERQGLSLTGIRQVAGTGWSIAGMVASQCGVPLMPRGFLSNNILESIDESFLPGVTCLSDLLARQGYQQTFVMGAEAKFAGTAAFYRTHGYQRTISQKDMQALFSPDEIAKANVVWFADDQMIYDTARVSFVQALRADAPFLFTIETIGPHGVPNYLSRQCTGDGQAAATRDVFLAADCLMELTTVLVADLQDLHRQSGRANGLRIILQSDHLNHARHLLTDDPKLALNTVILIGGTERGVKNDNAGTMLDVFPTVLDWLGFPVSGGKAGIGVSLLSPDAGTALAARWDVDMLDRIVMQNLPIFEQLWKGSH